jgi:hypothetical protein
MRPIVITVVVGLLASPALAHVTYFRMKKMVPPSTKREGGS